VTGRQRQNPFHVRGPDDHGLSVANAVAFSRRPRSFFGVVRLLALALVLVLLPLGAGADPFPVSIRVDAARPVGPMKPIWSFFGADEPNYATMPRGRELLAELGRLSPGGVYFRAHNLLNTGPGRAALKWGSTNAYTESAGGAPIYNWTILDGIFDAYRGSGLRPYVEIGFMPEALSTHPGPYQHSWRPGAPYASITGGWAYPPKDYGKWAALVEAWVRHCVDRYGQAEVQRWFWETWNEPNGAAYWHGSAEEFCKLHDYAVAAVRRALPTACVGGPDLAGSTGPFFETFLRHVTEGANYATGERGTPTDFLSFHAKGSPSFVEGHVRMGIAAQLRTIDRGFRLVSSFPALRGKRIVIGECDPDGCAACQGPQLGYRTGPLYASYTAAALAREYRLADQWGVNLAGVLTWAFEFEDQPVFSGQRVLATGGIDLPILNLFRMLAQMGGERLAVASTAEVPLEEMIRAGVRSQPDVSAIAARDGRNVAILVWHYHDDDVPGPPAALELTVDHLPVREGLARLEHERIDATHGDPFEVWRRMGSPARPSAEQLARLKEAGRLQSLGDIPATVAVANASATLRFTLPREAVSLIVVRL
jgi:xylan 1,4-beta-xylosidase